jgi:uncharacterized membrane protein HdeD (DUF308 family)
MEWIHKQRNLLLVEGAVFTILGFLAAALPGISTLSVALFVGWLFFFSGGVQFYRTIQARQMPGYWASILTSLLYIIFGLLLAFFPVAGALSLTLLMTIFFIAEGTAKIILGFQLKPFKNWAWFILNGALSLGIAYLIWSGWPATGLWVLGLFAGINMIFFGMALIFLALGLPKADKPVV